MKKNAVFMAGASALALCAAVSMTGCAHKAQMTADEAVKGIYSVGFVDLEGAKVKAIIVEYSSPVLSSSIDEGTYTITDFTKRSVQNSGYEAAIEEDYDGIRGNEGEITRVYVNDRKETSDKGGTKKGNFVVIETNTSYMLSAANLIYTTTMMAGVTQVKDIETKGGTVTASSTEFNNYTLSTRTNEHTGRTEDVISTDKATMIFPEFAEGSGWTLNYKGNGAFKATGCYSEYTGKYEDFELPYSIYVPSMEVLEKNRGKVALVIHMEHAAALDDDPMAAITSSKAAVKLTAPSFQAEHPAIVVVPQVEEERRSTDDMDASSEANPAFWELLDYLTEKYSAYIDMDRIYGTGQSMGGMSILYMASQRDNYFAGIAVIGSQWSNSYDKEVQHNGVQARSPANDTVSFRTGTYDPDNYQNWYYMVSDDNILVHTCAGDPMATGEWQALADYFKAAGGVTVPYAEWDPYLAIEEQDKIDSGLTDHDSTLPGSGITWGAFSKGGHMSTWKYGYQINSSFEWLFAQNRETEIKRGKIEALKNPWLGRNEDGTVREGSGTSGLNSAQYTPNGESSVYVEGWTRESVRGKKEENVFKRGS